MASTLIEWRDLLAWPFERANCYQLAEEVCRRAGLLLPAPPDRWDEAAAEVAPALRFVGATASAAREVGDLIVGDPEKKGYASHVAVLVCPAVALSTSVLAGAYAWRPSRHPCHYGVWRPTIRLPANA